MVKARKVRPGFVALVAITLVAAGTLTSAPPASAQQQQYGNLTARWWSWVYSQPAVDIGGTNTNPVLDSTGEYGAVGQENGIGPANKFFFLTGTFGGTAVRTLTVPQGKGLFFPIFNSEVDNAVDPPTSYGVPELRALAKANIDAATVIGPVQFGVQDVCFTPFTGEDVEVFRATSPTFNYTVPEKDSIYSYFGLTDPQFTGRIKPAVADGYWAYIPPPVPGQYELTFQSASSTGFSLDVTYCLTVK